MQTLPWSVCLSVLNGDLTGPERGPESLLCYPQLSRWGGKALARGQNRRRRGAEGSGFSGPHSPHRPTHGEVPGPISPLAPPQLLGQLAPPRALPSFHRAASPPALPVPGASRPGRPCTPSFPLLYLSWSVTHPTALRPCPAPDPTSPAPLSSVCACACACALAPRPEQCSPHTLHPAAQGSSAHAGL